MMSLVHRIREWIKHRRSSKSRHGVHSPFVYSLIEEGLRKKNPPESGLMLVTTKQKVLINKIIAWHRHEHILWLSNKEGEEETFISTRREKEGSLLLTTGRYRFDCPEEYSLADIILLDLPAPADWEKAWEKYRPLFHPGLMIVLPSVHLSFQHTQTWDRLREDPAVRLSIDLYHVGLLFFREEFREKQHFSLKHYS